MRLSQKVALISGAARGIGASIARLFAQEGARVYLGDVELTVAQKVAQEIQRKGGWAQALFLDVANCSSIRQVVETVLAQEGRIDILVNNAGICPLESPEEINEENWQRVLDVNLKGAFFLSQAVLESMKKRGAGRIINISSLAGKMGGLQVGAHYAASKGGLLALTKSLARHLAPYGITVNALAPGTTDTELTRTWPEEVRQSLISQIPLGRLARPEEVAQAALFLASEEAAYITGEVLDVNGGLLMD